MKLRYVLLAAAAAALILIYEDAIQVPNEWNLWIAGALFALGVGLLAWGTISAWRALQKSRAKRKGYRPGAHVRLGGTGRRP